MNEFDLYSSYIKSGDIAYDIGAHIGEISVQMKNKGADVYAFEPSPNNFPTLKKNCEHLGIKCYDVALHEKTYDCDTPFKDCKTDYYDASGKKTDSIQHIRYHTLENFIKENTLPMPNFIKLDIEGMESLVLKTFKFLFESSRPTMYVEIHAAQRGNLIQNYEDNPHWKWVEEGGFDFNLLKKFNYTILNSAGKINHNTDWNPQENTHSGLLLIPNEYE
jgi:FkbM family methyltransferase